jgi:hypothetical protein
VITAAELRRAAATQAKRRWTSGVACSGREGLQPLCIRCELEVLIRSMRMSTGLGMEEFIKNLGSDAPQSLIDELRALHQAPSSTAPAGAG